MPKVIKCTECNMPGGTVPKYYWDDVVEMVHEACAIRNIERYRKRKELEEVSPC